MAKKKSIEELVADMKNINKKIQTLEKFMNDEKKQKETKFGKIDKSTENLDNAIRSLKIEVQAMGQRFENDLEETDKNLQQSIDEFNTFRTELAEEMEKIEEKDKALEDLRSQIKEKNIVLKEKEKELKDVKNQFSESISRLAKLESDYENLEEKYNQAQTLSEELKDSLESTKKEYKEFKAKEEPVMAQNESIRRILNVTDQGKIYLALVESFPKSLTIDDLSNTCDTTAVLLKPSLLAMEEIEVIEFNPSTREVKLVEYD
jgi:chromosome segregation ATPase